MFSVFLLKIAFKMNSLWNRIRFLNYNAKKTLNIGEILINWTMLKWRTSDKQKTNKQKKKKQTTNTLKSMKKKLQA